MLNANAKRECPNLCATVVVVVCSSRSPFCLLKLNTHLSWKRCCSLMCLLRHTVYWTQRSWRSFNGDFIGVSSVNFFWHFLLVFDRDEWKKREKKKNVNRVASNLHQPVISCWDFCVSIDHVCFFSHWNERSKILTTTNKQFIVN